MLRGRLARLTDRSVGFQYQLWRSHSLERHNRDIVITEFRDFFTPEFKICGTTDITQFSLTHVKAQFECAEGGIFPSCLCDSEGDVAPGHAGAGFLNCLSGSERLLAGAFSYPVSEPAQSQPCSRQYRVLRGHSPAIARRMPTSDPRDSVQTEISLRTSSNWRLLHYLT